MYNEIFNPIRYNSESKWKNEDDFEVKKNTVFLELRRNKNNNLEMGRLKIALMLDKIKFENFKDFFDLLKKVWKKEL